MKFAEAVRFFNYLCRRFGLPELPWSSFGRLPATSLLEGQFWVEGGEVRVEFQEGEISARVVVHEFLHYFFYVADLQQALRGRAGADESILDDLEERFAYEVSPTLASHYLKAYKRGMTKINGGKRK